MKKIILMLCILMLVISTQALGRKPEQKKTMKQVETINTKSKKEKLIDITGPMTTKSHFGFPIEVNVDLSQSEVEVGDIVDVIVSAKLDKNHENFDFKDKYVILNQQNILVYALHMMGVPSVGIERAIHSHNNKHKHSKKWEIISSDDDVILNSADEVYTYSFSIKITKMPNTESIALEIPFFKFQASEDYGGYADYIYPDSKDRLKHEQNTYYIELQNKDFIEKEDSNFGVKISDIQSEPLQNVDEFIPKKLTATDLSSTHRTTYDVLINTTIEIPRDDDVSNVSCDSNIGTASQNGNDIIFNASNNTGAIGYICFTYQGDDAYIEIRLVSSYDVEGPTGGPTTNDCEGNENFGDM